MLIHFLRSWASVCIPLSQGNTFVTRASSSLPQLLLLSMMPCSMEYSLGQFTINKIKEAIWTKGESRSLQPPKNYQWISLQNFGKCLCTDLVCVSWGLLRRLLHLLFYELQSPHAVQILWAVLACSGSSIAVIPREQIPNTSWGDWSLPKGAIIHFSPFFGWRAPCPCPDGRPFTLWEWHWCHCFHITACFKGCGAPDMFPRESLV